MPSLCTRTFPWTSLTNEKTAPTWPLEGQCLSKFCRFQEVAEKRIERSLISIVQGRTVRVSSTLSACLKVNFLATGRVPEIHRAAQNLIHSRCDYKYWETKDVFEIWFIDRFVKFNSVYKSFWYFAARNLEKLGHRFLEAIPFLRSAVGDLAVLRFFNPRSADTG